MVINHNMSAMFAQRSQGIQDLNQQKSMEKLSSGMRINRAGDDASGLAVSEKMRAQIRGLNQASTNAQNGISFIQTTEGYLQETTDIVQRIRELAVQSSNGIYSSEDRMQIQQVKMLLQVLCGSILVLTWIRELRYTLEQCQLWLSVCAMLVMSLSCLSLLQMKLTAQSELLTKL